LRGANCDRTYGGEALGSWSIFCLVIEPETVALEPSRRSDRWQADGIAYARDHAGRVPLVMAARMGRSLDLFGLDYQIDEDVRDGRPRWGAWAGVVSFWVLAPIALLGITRWQGIPRWLLVAPVLTVGLSTLAFYGGHRIRAPVEPVVVVVAGAAAVRLLWDRRRSRQPRAGAMTVAASPHPGAGSGASPDPAGVGRFPSAEAMPAAARTTGETSAGTRNRLIP
jgi:hypothetical protein